MKKLITVLILSISFSVMLLAIPRKSGNIAVITIDSTLVQEIDLTVDSEFVISEYEVLKNVQFEVLDNCIRIVNSDCPDKVCVKTGFIGKTGETIVCLPKKLIIAVK